MKNIKIQILEAINSDDSRIGKFNDVLNQYRDLAVDAINQILYEQLITTLPRNVAADGSIEYSITPMTKLTQKGIEYLDQNK